MKDQGFRRAGKGVFACEGCGRPTRQSDNNGCELCYECYTLAGEDNTHNDDGTTPDPTEMVCYNSFLKAVGDKGGDVERVRRSNRYLWPL